MASFRKKSKTKDAPWYFTYTDADGRRRELRGCPDKKATEQIARDHETKAAMVRTGLVDPKDARYRESEGKPLADHLSDLHADLLARGNTVKHADLTRSRIAKIIGMANLERIPDLSAARVQGGLGKLQADGLGIESINHYVRAMKMFSAWLYRNGLCRDHHLISLKTRNSESDRRHERRALTADESKRLVDSALAGEPFRGLTGLDRAMLYLTAFSTGLRVSELGSIPARGFDLDASPPTVTVKAAYTKNRRVGVQPLPVGVAVLLRDYLRDRPPSALVWPGTWKERAAKMVRRDLERVGIPYQDADGRFADFHASRHTFVSNLVSSGVSVKVAQTLARHSTPTLTIGRYAHAAPRDLSAALEGLPILVNPGTGLTSRIDVTGTIPAEPISDHLSASLARAGDGTGQSPASLGEITSTLLDAPPDPNSIPLTNFGESWRDLTGGVATSGVRTRTGDLRIMRPPL
jgi:site-specific recombinase XerD